MKNNQGFTLVEIGVIVPILMVLALSLFTVLLSYVQSSGNANLRLTQTYTLQDALNRIESDVKLSPGMLATSPSSTPDPSAASGWNFNGSGASNRVLVISEFATTTNPASALRSPVYVTASDPSCSDSNAMLKYTVIYFVGSSDKTLYRRTLIDNSQTCTPQYQKLSCAPSTPKSGSCANAADDEIVATNVSQFSADYYTDGSTGTPMSPYGASPSDNVTSAKSVNVTLGLSQRGYSGNVTGQSSLRITTINNSGGAS